MRSWQGRRIAAGAFVMLAIAPGSVRAADSAKAATLYNEAYALMESSKLDEACPRFQQSFDLAPAPKTKVAVALCHERQGRLATAWAEYQEGVQLARQAKDERVRTAAFDRAGNLEPRVPHLTIRVGAPVPDLAVRLDGAPRAAATWSVALPVDPGIHRVRATATRYEPFEREVTVGEAQAIVVEVPALKPTPAATPEPVAEPKPEPAPKADGFVPWWGYAAFGAAALGIGTGVVFGLSAVSDDHDADKSCKSSPCTDSKAVDASASADTKAWVSNIAFGAAIAFIAVGLYAVIARPGRAAPRQGSSLVVGRF